MSRFVLRGDLCYSESRTRLHTLPGGYLVCVDGRSEGVYAELPERYRDLPLIETAGALITPGLTDLHTHAPQFSFRGLGLDLELLDWLNTHTFPEEAKYAQLDYAERAYKALLDELLRGPNTRCCLFATVHLPATKLLMELMESSGLVCAVGKVNMDRNSPASLCELSAAASIDDTRRWIEESVGRYRNIFPILTPRFIPSCSDELLRGLADLQRAYKLPVQSHLSENQSEVSWVRALCPESAHYCDAYDSFGLFGGAAPTIMAHCVWSGPEEIALMKERGVFIAHCPQSNANLASGIAPVRTFLAQDLRVGLGSDVAGGCHSSIFRAMADAIQASKLRWRLCDDTLPPLTLEEAFYLGTRGGGAFFGEVGSFDPGFEFDALVIDDRALGSISERGIEERLSRVIYLSDDRQIRAKYVRGVPVLPATGVPT